MLQAKLVPALQGIKMVRNSVSRRTFVHDNISTLTMNLNSKQPKFYCVYFFYLFIKVS